MAYTDVNGIRIYYEVIGLGDPLVIINGLGIDVSEFRTLSAAFAKTHRVLVFDNRGAGRTDKPDEPYSIEQMAVDTAGVMKAAGLKKAHVIGISMGGRIAQELALTHPEMVDKLILTSTSARTYQAHSLYRFFVSSVMPMLPIFKGKYPQPNYAFKRQRAASRSYNCVDRLHEIDTPTLITHGVRDKSAPLELAEEMYTGIEGSDIKTFNGGHLFFLFRERKDYVRTVNTFLAD